MTFAPLGRLLVDLGEVGILSDDGQVGRRVARTDAGSLYADASSILKSAKFGKCAHGKHYKFVTE